MKLLEIPIGRFQADTPLTRDTFLFLPLNNKVIRIAVAGEVISESMLSRILAKGHTHLRVNEELSVDPNTFAIHSGLPEIVAPPLQPVSVADEQSQVVGQSAEEEAPGTKFAPADTSVEPVSTFTPSPPEEEAAIRFSATAEEEPSQTFKASAESEESQKVTGSDFSQEDETRLGASASEDESENRFKGDEEENIASQTVAGGQETQERYVRKFAPEKEALSAVIRLQKKMSEAKENERAFDLSSEKEQALKEAKTVILSSKISEKIISLSEQARVAEPGLRDSLRSQVRGLKTELDQVDNGYVSLEENAEAETKEEISAVAESLASASRAEQVEEISERLSAHALTRELAMSALEETEALEEKELSRSATSRDLPSTVSRLAAYLGHSLGYTNVDFLADLACGAIVHFAKKEGEALNEDLLPSFTRRIISTDETPDETITDSREILQFLDLYIEDKECDRSHKDLMKRVFDRTMLELSERENGPSPLSLRKWSSFVNRGPTMDSHSICTRAAAKAVKFARSASK